MRTPEDWARPPLGSSLAVNGTCLTLIAWEGGCFVADLSTETIERTTFRTLRTGDRVNLERPLAMGAPLGGHIVTGHVDGKLRLKARGSLRSAQSSKLRSFSSTLKSAWRTTKRPGSRRRVWPVWPRPGRNF